MSAILLSIKPQYVSRIFNSTKKYEFRRTRAQQDITKILIYETAPVMQVVGEVEVVAIISLKPSPLWEMTKKEAGISRAKFREYFRGCKLAYAYKLGKVLKYEEPKPLSFYGISSPPQSFVYIEDRLESNRLLE